MEHAWSSLRSLFSKGGDPGTSGSEFPSQAGSLLELLDLNGIPVRARNVFDDLPPPTGLMAMLLRQLRSHVRDGHGVIAIHGMGGVGKSALLMLYIKDLSSRAHDFNVVIPIRISDRSDVDDIQYAIAGCLGLRWRGDKSQKQRAASISKALQKKKFLLLLDEVWRPLDLKALGVPVSTEQSSGCVVVTSRFEDVCLQMGAKKIIKMRCLPWEESWALFAKTAGKELINSDQDICSNAEELAWACGGLPAVLVRAAHTMKRSTDPAKLTEASQPLGMDRTFLHQLKLSYDYLGSDELRACFLDCAMFAGNHHFLSAWVIEYWMAEGISFIEFGWASAPYRHGRNVIGMLTGSSLLDGRDESNECSKMHPVIHDMALWIANEFGRRNRWLVRPSAGLTEAPRAEEWREAERMSLMDNKITDLPESPDCPKLEFLLLRENSSLERIHSNFFRGMPSLRVLDMSDTAIRELPAGISELRQLRYLSLYNTKITSLPEELGQLSKLRVLNLALTPNLRAIPEGIFSRMTELKVLVMYISYGGWWAAPACRGRRVNLEELTNLAKLSTLGITVGTKEAFMGIQTCLAVVTLHITGCDGLTSIGLKKTPFCLNMECLRWLMISECVDLDEIVLERPLDPFDPAVYTAYPTDQWPPPPPFRSLELLYLVGLEKTRIIHEGGSFVNLLSLHIAYCYGMEHLLYSSSSASSYGRTIDPFPKLRELHLTYLPRLASLTEGKLKIEFKCLQLLVVEECPELKNLSLARPHCDIEVRGSQEWWEALEIKVGIGQESFVSL